MLVDKNKIDWNAPAFARAEESSSESTTEVSQTESGGGEPVVTPAPVEEGTATSGAEPVVDEQKVPYSRFSTALSRAKEAEREAEEARRHAMELEERLRTREYQPSYAPQGEQGVEIYKGVLPGSWIRLYGDSDASREAYSLELIRQREIEERAERRAIEAYERRSTEERQALSSNERLIDDRLEDLSALLGRDLTEKEESAVLDIVDEYTPKDEYGNYAGDTIPFEKAWEIYEMRNEHVAQAAKKSRSNATAATSTRTEGEPTGREKNYENWNPQDWNAYRRRI